MSDKAMSEGDILVDQRPERAVAPSEKPLKKKPKLDLTFFLDRSCGNADDFRHWEKYEQDRMNRNAAGDYTHIPYDGWMRYDITLHCTTFTIIAKRDKNGGYHVRDYIEQDH